jgi:acetoacetyl-CoA reductase
MESNMQNDKPVAIVTGGTGGIGSAIAAKLSKDFQVISCYFKNGNHDHAKSWQQAQKEAGNHIDVLYGNIANYTDCEEMVSFVQKKYHRIDALINNAGVTADSSLKKMTPEQWHKVIDANLTGVFNMTRNVLPVMLENNYGRIVNISSINGHKGQFGQCNYAAAKAGLLGFTKSLALEVASRGITVNTISPGYIKTAMLDHVKPEVLDSIVAQIPVGRLGSVEDIALGVYFLCQKDANFITGANIDINGGQYM